MPTVVKLQNNLSNWLFLIIILFIVLISPLIIMLIKRSRARREMLIQSVYNSPGPRPLPQSIKMVYINRLEAIGRNIDDKVISVREGYQQFSLLIREFVLEYEGIDVTKQTLAEIRAHNIPGLTELVEEYYVPEFSQDIDHDYRTSISKTIRVIDTWN